MALITLTTDFGTRDWFVGTLKGVIAGVAPGSAVVDITHDVSPGDVRGGAFALAAAAPYFPAGTIHVAVVDPGVGSARRAIALRTGRAIFIGPDNGLLSWAVRDQVVEEVRQLTNRAWHLKPVSRTFHARDVFAPVAAEMADGAAFSDAGELVDAFERLAWPDPKPGQRGLAGEVLYVDRFGNAMTNLPSDAVPGDQVTLCAGEVAAPVVSCYSAVDRGEPLAIAGSCGLMELAINGGDFAGRHGVKPGSKVEAVW